MATKCVTMATFMIVCACTTVFAQDGPSETIARKGWSFDRSKFTWARWSDPKEQKARGALSGAAGWVEYDFTVPKDNWYALWIGGIPYEWDRNIYLDGKPVLCESIATTDDVLSRAEARKRGVNYKEANLYLRAGKHRIRFERLGFPGVLPSAWQLVPATGKPEECLFAEVAGRRIVAPGELVTLSVQGGAKQPTEYQLKLTDRLTNKTYPVGKIAFPASDKPLTRKATLTLPDQEGLYLITAETDGVVLRPADLKAGYVMAVKDEVKKVESGDPKLALAGLFTDRAVLQRDKPLPIWGKAPPNQEVTVTLADQSAKAVADAHGDWRVTLKPMPAGGPHVLSVTCQDQTLSRRDILVGEVWLLSGQSNMGGPLLTCLGGEDAARKADMPTVRIGCVYGHTDGLVNNIGWMPAVSKGDPKNLRRWAGIHFGFGKAIHDALDVPVGLIAANRGGTIISTWTSVPAHKEDDAFRSFYDQYVAYTRPENSELRNINHTIHAISKWRKNVADVPEGKSPPKPPKLQARMRLHNSPGMHYDALIEPCSPYAMRGVLWYQGESDSRMAAIYPKRFACMVKNWRDIWKAPKMPFITVQISYGSGQFDDRPQPGDEKGAEMRDCQLKCSQTMPDVYMVVSQDLMRPEDNVHYLDKLPVGERLANAALAEVYGKDVVYQGPMYSRLSVEGPRARLHFSHTDGGLKSKGDKLKGFSIAGEDRVFHWADAEIDGDTVLVHADAVKHPVAVRYGWSGYRGANLFNGAGLPAPTFRTDDWPLSTEGCDFMPIK